MQVIRRCTALVAAIVVSALCLGAPAVAAGPATVSVRIEGQSDTLVPRTVLTTTTQPVNKDGQPGHECTGTSALGALDTATAGQWDGTWFGEYFVESIKGEAHRYPDPEGWGFFVNNRGSSAGACSVEMAHGDELLFFVTYCEFDPNVGDCTNPPVLPLGLVDVPGRVEQGRPFTVRVIRYDRDGQSAPVSGATVSGGGATGTTGDDGRATLGFGSPGEFSLRAEKPGFVRSDFARVCVYDPAAGGCDVAPPALPGAAPLDTRLPAIAFLGIAEGQRFAARRAPRLLRGTVDPGGAGLHAVRFRLRRSSGGPCTFYSALQERFRRGRCDATWFLYRLGDRPDWDYLLPARLGAGRYVLTLRVMDKWGREVTRLVRFTVLGSAR